MTGLVTVNSENDQIGNLRRAAVSVTHAPEGACRRGHAHQHYLGFASEVIMSRDVPKGWENSRTIYAAAMRALQTGESVDQLVAAARSLSATSSGSLSILPSKSQSSVMPNRSVRR